MLKTVTLRHAGNPVREAGAWFIPGADAAAWLEEVARWPVAMEDVRLLIVAQADHAIPAGVLAIPPADTRVPPGGRAQPYGAAAPGLFAPVDAVLHPPLAPEELRAIARHPVAVWHPALGLTGFDEGAERRAWDLLAPPTLLEEPWHRARAGAPPAPRLRAVRLIAELSLEDLFGEENSDIASDSPEDLPPTPDEPQENLLARLARDAGAKALKTLLALSKLAPRTARSPTWVNAVENWAAQRLSGLNDDLDHIRNKELHRLLELLKNNPHQGLRHAISLSSLAHRGRARPSGQLGPRGLDFKLGRLGGGGPADFWDVPDPIRTSLAKSYRELALRELKLGHHRRAACIFAELLGDFSAAASALKEGRFFREAAVLYQERLHSPLAAAECLASGGLWPEAIALYEKLERWLDVADLHGRLGHTEAEHVALRRAVDAHLQRGEVVAAAQLIEKRLAAPDEALTLLAHQWPAGRQPLACLEERFALLERHHRHRDTRELLVVLARQNIPRLTIAPLSGLLAKIAETTADGQVRHCASNLVRVKVAGALSEGVRPPDEEKILLRALVRLAPADKLLLRDTQRFRDTRPPPLPAPKRAAVAGPKDRITVTRGPRKELWTQGSYVTAIGDENGFHVAGFGPGRNVVLASGTWGGETDVRPWPDPVPDRRDQFILATHETSVVFARPGGPGLAVQGFGSAYSLARLSNAGTPAWFPPDAVQAASSRFTLWAVRLVAGRVVLDSYAQGTIAGTRDVTDELAAAGATADEGATLSLNAAGAYGKVALGYGRHLLTLENQRDVRVEDLGAGITGLLATPGHTPGWIVLLERGAVFFSSLASSAVLTVDDTLDRPRGTFLGDGRLVLVSGTEGRILTLADGTVATTVARRFELPATDTVALLRKANPREFALITRAGGILTWQVDS